MNKIAVLCNTLDHLYTRHAKVNFDYTLQLALGNVELATHLQMQLDAIEVNIDEVRKELRVAFDNVEKGE